ncbi:hypothetical protein JL720_7883 [Aureococcus anophagefferens]|nr:hypothetical protein JL720_7883 [Aureococcus anophagefferens]
MGKHLVNEFITADYKESVQEVFMKALDGVETANFGFPCRRSRARVRSSSATTRRDEQGAVIGVVGIGQDITARIAQEQEYARLIDTANAPIFGVDANGNVNVWNRCASNLTGFGGQDVMGKHLVNEFITPEYKAPVQNVFDSALEASTANESASSASARTSRRASPRSRSTRLIDTANAPIFGIDVNGHVNVWNQCASNLTEFDGDEVGQPPRARVHPRGVPGERAERLRQRADGDRVPMITRVEILLNATTRRDAMGAVVGVVGIGQDITARIAQEREYARLIDTANAPIFGVDVNGHVNVWNQCASNLTGFAGEEVMGNHLVSTFITVEYRTSVQDVLEGVRGVEAANFEFPLMNKDGTRLINILLNATTRRDAMGGVVGVVGIGQDISEARAKQDAVLRQRAVWKSNLQPDFNAVELALEEGTVARRRGVAADQEQGRGAQERLPKQVRQLTEHQRLVCQHAVNTLNDMLDVAKIENGMYTPKEGVVDLGDLCSRGQAQGPRLRPGVELVVDAPPQGSLVVLTDSVLLLQFLTNLLSNAAKFTSAGKVMVHCHVLSAPAEGSSISKPAASDSDEYVDLVLAVADTGPGIATAQQQRVLLAFTTGDAVPHEDLRDASRSTGIGLRLADLIANVLCSAEPHQPEGFRTSVVGGGGGGGGSPGEPPASGEKKWWRKQRRGIQLESPVSAEARLAAPSPSLGGFRLELRGRMRVLVVDDQRTMRQMVATLFQRLCQDNADLRVELHTCLSGEQAIRQAAACTYHVITMDEQLSEPYCRAVAKERCDREAKGELNAVARGADGLPAPLGFGPDRIENAQKRLAFFDAEIDYQSPRDGDGILPGHEAISRIREAEARAPAAIIFNLTGNRPAAGQRNDTARLFRPAEPADERRADDGAAARGRPAAARRPR